MRVENTRRNVIEKILHQGVDQETNPAFGFGIAEVIYPIEFRKRRFHGKDHPIKRFDDLKSPNYT